MAQRHATASGRIRWSVAVATCVGGVGLLGLTGASPAAAVAKSPTVVTVTHSKTWGPVLTLSNGETLYRLTADPANKSVCNGTCTKIWPPVVLAAGQKSPVGRGVASLGTITRSNGARQVTYEGVPLYRYIGDHKAGQANGNLKDEWGQWWVVNPSQPRAVPTAVTKSGGNSSPSSTAAGSGVAY